MAWARQPSASSQQLGTSTPTIPSQTKQELTKESAFVTIADLNIERGEQVARELAPYAIPLSPCWQFSDEDRNAQFVQCNIVNWDEQVQVFEAAIANSPNKSCDIVIANAGISRASGDSLWPLDGTPLPTYSNSNMLPKRAMLIYVTDINASPVKPTLSIVDVNLTGTLYTWKLAVHYFRKQPDTEDRDRCFIITGSMVAWIDSPVHNLHL